MNTHDLAAMDLGTGIGLRNVHFNHILETQPELDFFEILSENYMHTGGRTVHVLDQIAERYPVIMHGVSMNIGSPDPLDFEYLAELKRLRDRCGARFVSDHICWTGVGGTNLHDLLPLPYTEEVLKLMVSRVNQVQDLMAAPLILENPSTYLEFAHSQMSETQFLTALADETSCGFLMDLNNVFVCASNHDFDAKQYLDEVPWHAVVQFHLAGHTTYDTHKLDTHDREVCDEVWELYRIAHLKSGGRTTLLEWDANIPSFDEVRAEAWKARDMRKELDSATPEAEGAEAQTSGVEA